MDTISGKTLLDAVLGDTDQESPDEEKNNQEIQDQNAGEEPKNEQEAEPQESDGVDVGQDTGGSDEEVLKELRLKVYGKERDGKIVRKGSDLWFVYTDDNGNEKRIPLDRAIQKGVASDEAFAMAAKMREQAEEDLKKAKEAQAELVETLRNALRAKNVAELIALARKAGVEDPYQVIADVAETDKQIDELRRAIDEVVTKKTKALDEEIAKKQMELAQIDAQVSIRKVLAEIEGGGFEYLGSPVKMRIIKADGEEDNEVAPAQVIALALIGDLAQAGLPLEKAKENALNFLRALEGHIQAEVERRATEKASGKVIDEVLGDKDALRTVASRAAKDPALREVLEEALGAIKPTPKKEGGDSGAGSEAQGESGSEADEVLKGFFKSLIGV